LALILIVFIFQLSKKNAITHRSFAESDVEEVGVAIATPSQLRAEAKKAAKVAKAAKRKAKK
jgi:hypothetical protein